MRISPRANLLIGAVLLTTCCTVTLALAAPPPLPLILALNPQPLPPGFWDSKHKFIPLSLLPPEPCRRKSYFFKNMAACEAHLIARKSG